MHEDDQALRMLEYLCESQETRLDRLMEMVHDRDRLVVRTSSTGTCGHDGPVTNVILPAKDTSRPRVVVMAHYDCWPGSYGYNDNGTGLVAALLLQDRLPAHAEIVFTDNEEKGFRGADRYLDESPGEIAFGVNLDIVGVPDTVYFKTYGDMEITVPEGIKSRRLPSLVPNDCQAFAHRKIPAVIVMSGPTQDGPAEPMLRFLTDIWDYQHGGPLDRRDGAGLLSMAQVRRAADFAAAIVSADGGRPRKRQELSHAIHAR